MSKNTKTTVAAALQAAGVPEDLLELIISDPHFAGRVAQLIRKSASTAPAWNTNEISNALRLLEIPDFVVSTFVQGHEDALRAWLADLNDMTQRRLLQRSQGRTMTSIAESEDAHKSSVSRTVTNTLRGMREFASGLLLA